MHGERIHAVRLQLVLLVLHEGDERAHHYREAGHQQRRKLVDDGLSAPGGHDDEGIASLERRLDRFPLAAPEIGMAEALAQHGASAFLRCGSWHAGRKSTKRAGREKDRWTDGPMDRKGTPNHA